MTNKPAIEDLLADYRTRTERIEREQGERSAIRGRCMRIALVLDRADVIAELTV